MSPPPAAAVLCEERPACHLAPSGNKPLHLSRPGLQLTPAKQALLGPSGIKKKNQKKKRKKKKRMKINGSLIRFWQKSKRVEPKHAVPEVRASATLPVQ